MDYHGYHFFLDNLEFPYAPSELTVSIGSNNQTVSLVSGNEINILKDPKLTTVKFKIELPRGRQYPFANKLVSSKTYTDYFEKLMVNKQPAKLVITRPTRKTSGIGGTIKDFESTVLTVSLEGYELEESAENANDIIVSLDFREYVSYGTVKKTVVNNNKPIVNQPLKPVTQNTTYVVRQGDTLCKISKKFYGTSDKWKIIYNANQSIIEQTARKHGKKSSSNGWWIYPDTKLVIPK